MHPLERARRARGWTRPEMAEMLCQMSARDDAVATLGTGRDGIWRFEHGRVPDHLTQSLIAGLLGIPQETADARSWPEWLAADPLQLPVPHPWDPPGAIQALDQLLECENMDRRKFILISGTTLTSSLLAWLTADPAAAGQLVGGRRIGEAAVAHIEDRVRELRHADDADGGGQLVSEASASLSMVTSLLKDRSYTADHGARLHAAAADLARIRAWSTFDVEDVCADTTFDGALHAAQAASDPALGAHILAFWSIAASNTGRPGDAEAMVSAALAAVRGRTTPRVEAMLYSRRARARARLGDHRCWQDIGRSSDCLDAVTSGHEDPEWVYWFDRSELLGVAASTHLDFGQPAQAEQSFADAAAQFPSDRIRTRALFLTRQADAQLLQNDLERACSTASEALDLTMEISSQRSVGPLRDLAAKMRPHDSVPAVHDFREHIRTILSAA